MSHHSQLYFIPMYVYYTTDTKLKIIMTSSVNVKYNYATNYRDYISYAINITINEKIVEKL